MSLFSSLHAGEAAHAFYDAITQGYDGETFLVSDQSSEADQCNSREIPKTLSEKQ
ncbi:hypothetical protein RHGRI_034939 [Rhododendron griersonianum]|uniref:Uncharacterized protein n=1 Tax=Rhododendron griersonianum TaxID=479676 RepID=A0AAV6I2N9_9ERIC|nr:hypothetical protein RHGRI_034939 [Rhododendron griersonianum]